MSAPSLVSVNLGPDGTSSSEWPAIVEAHPTSFKIEVKLNQEIFLDMELTNTTQSLVSFKVKTTARDRYLLRPTQDYIPPNSTKSCKIVMARLSEWPDLSNPKNAKDKFLVQSCILKEPVADLSKMWKDLESIHTPKQNRFAYHEQRVKCKLSLPKSKEKEKDKNDKSAATPDPLSPTSATTSTSTRTPSRPASPAPAPAPSVPTANIASFIQSQSTPATTTSTSTSVSGSTSARDVDDDVDDEGGMVSARGKESETVTALRLSLERKQRELDELMDFVVKLTAHNERLKAETGTLQSTVKKNQEQISTYQQRIQTLQEQVQTQQERPETPVQPMPVIHAEPGEGEGLRHRQREQGEPETVIPKETSIVTNNGIQMWLVAIIAMLAFVLGYVFK